MCVGLSSTIADAHPRCEIAQNVLRPDHCKDGSCIAHWSPSARLWTSGSCDCPFEDMPLGSLSQSTLKKVRLESNCGGSSACKPCGSANADGSGGGVCSRPLQCNCLWEWAVCPCHFLSRNSGPTILRATACETFRASDPVRTHESSSLSVLTIDDSVKLTRDDRQSAQFAHRRRVLTLVNRSIMGLRQSKSRQSPASTATAPPPAALPSSRAPLELVADVSLCLVMHGLATIEICHLSRSSKRLFEVTRNAFAWSRCPPHRLLVKGGDSTVKDEVTIPSRPPKGVPVLLTWLPGDDGPLTLHDRDALIALLDRMSGHQITSLDASSCANMRHQLPRILAHPALSRLQSVVLFREDRRGAISSDLLRALADLPQLSSLELWPSPVCIHCDWSLLCQLRSLTSLQLADEFSASEPRLSAGVAACTALRQLSLFNPALHGSRFKELFCRPNIAATLERLHLREFCPTEATTAVLRTGFAALTKLTRLQLSGIFSVDRLLPSAGFAPVLRFIELTVASESCHPPNSVVPSVSAIERLIAQSPRIHLAIRLECPADPLDMYSAGHIASVEGVYAEQLCFQSRPAPADELKEGAWSLRVFCGAVEQRASDTHAHCQQAQTEPES